ncbi:MAG: tape measure protein [Gammaproteobacteria bacterium]|nr:tape measure protein [Gammaproteobacteria bacterium]
MAELAVTIDGRGAVTGASQVTRSLDQIRRGAANTNQALGRANRGFRQTAKSSASLGQAIGALGGVLAIGRVIAYSDAWTLVQNRIRLVTDSSAELTAVTEQVFKITQEARVPLASTAELYQRIARSAEQLGISQQRVLDVTKSVSKAITISGVSATSATAAIVQLGQGLASGTLRGDELRSVLEQTPRLARAIADGLQVPIGALRELGKAGKLSAEAVIGALESQKDVLDKEFGDINVTIGQAFTNLENSLIRFIGRFGEATGFFKQGARSVQLLSANIDNLSEGFFEGAFEVSQFVSALAGGFSTLDEQAALAAANVKESFLGIFDGTTFGEDTIIGTILRNSPTGIAAKLLGVSDLAEEARNETEQLRAELANAERAVAEGLDAQRAAFQRAQEERRAARELELTTDPDPTGFAQPDPQAEKAAERLRKELERLGKALTESVQTPLEDFQSTISQNNRLLDAGVISTETYQRALALATETYRESLPEVQAYNEQLERGAAITAANITPQEQYNMAVAELNELLAVGAINQETFNRALISAQDELASALEKNDAFAKFLEQISIQAARNIQTAFADFLFDPFDEGLDGLLSNFVDVLKRMAAEALSAQVFKILGEQFGSLGGAAGGGGGSPDFLGGLFSSILGFADGGDFSAGRPIMVGEQGPEIITPRSPGTVIPNDGGQIAAPQVTVPVSITNVTDPAAIGAALNTASAQQAIVNAISQNPDAIKRALN